MKEKHNQPSVPLTIEILEALLESCKDIALLAAFDESEGLIFYQITEEIIALYNRFMDRALAEVFRDNNLSPDESVEEALERTKKRLLRDLSRGDNEELRLLALKSRAKPDKPN